MRFLNYLAILCITTGACKEKKTKGEPPVLSANLAVRADTTWKKKIQTVKKEGSEGLSITPVALNLNSYKQGVLGVSIDWEIKIEETCLKNARDRKFDCYYYNVGYHLKEENIPFDLSDIKNVRFSNLNTHPLISSKEVRKVNVHIPYRMLQTTEALNNLIVSLKIYPARFKKDKKMKEIKLLEKLDDKASASELYSIQIDAPPLKQLTLTVEKFLIDSINTQIKKFDFGVTGNGYPDLLWQAECGEEILFTSPVKKNSSTYNTTLTTPAFYASPDDSIKILFVDYDNHLVMNKNDVISTWIGSVKTGLTQFNKSSDPNLRKLKECKIKFEEKSLVQISHRQK